MFRRFFQAMTLRLLALWTGLTLIVLGTGALVVAWSGVYNVAASRDHFWVTRLLLEWGMRNSVRTYSAFTDPPADLGDPERARMGAGHFELVCAACHGSPLKRHPLVASRMLPAPPSLNGPDVTRWTDAEMFRIIKHGLKYTGMPAWPALERDDEVWALVAFVKLLPSLSDEDYRRLGRGNLQAVDTGGAGGLSFTARDPVAASCARCHGDGERPPVSAHVPVIAGQKESYLLATLEAYARGERQSGIMQPIALDLTREERVRVARSYADKTFSARETKAADDAAIERGRGIARRGVPEKGLPACLSCHGNAKAPYPHLEGQHAAYMAGQLRLWQQGLRSSSALGAIMAAVAQRLDDSQIDDVAAYFASLERPEHSQNEGPATIREGAR